MNKPDQKIIPESPQELLAWLHELKITAANKGYYIPDRFQNELYKAFQNKTPMEVMIEKYGKIIRRCKVCGCSMDDACNHPAHGNCWWVAIDLCSHCKLWPGEATRYSKLKL